MVVCHKAKARMMGIKYIPLFLFLSLSLWTERQQGEIHTHRQTQRDTQRCTPICVSYIYKDRCTQRNITHRETYLRHIYGK